jgi:hypothetical protein
MTTTESADTPQPRRSIAETLRLRLKPVRRSRGHVRGAWWPRSTRLADELHALLEEFAQRLGEIDRVHYHHTDWSPATPVLKHQGGEVILDPSAESPNVITLFGERFGRLPLLLVPPYTDASQAYAAMTTAASAGDESTPGQLLGHTERRAEDRRQALTASQRWAS